MTYCHAHDSGCGCEPGMPTYPEARIPMKPDALRQLADDLEREGTITLWHEDSPTVTFIKPVELAEVYYIREKTTNEWFCGGSAHEWGTISNALAYPDNHRPLPANAEWVHFTEVPF